MPHLTRRGVCKSAAVSTRAVSWDIVLRLPSHNDREMIVATLETVRDALREASPQIEGPDGFLWIVQPGRVRIHQREQA
jgi:hypothetical protein